MPSTTITKTNIKRDVLLLVKTQAALEELSSTKMIEKMIHAYFATNQIKHN